MHIKLITVSQPQIKCDMGIPHTVGAYIPRHKYTLAKIIFMKLEKFMYFYKRL